MSFWRKICYLRGIFGASSGRGGAEESCYKGTKKNRDMQVFYAIKFAYPKKNSDNFTNKAIFLSQPISGADKGFILQYTASCHHRQHHVHQRNG